MAYPIMKNPFCFNTKETMKICPLLTHMYPRSEAWVLNEAKKEERKRALDNEKSRAFLMAGLNTEIKETKKLIGLWSSLSGEDVSEFLLSYSSFFSDYNIKTFIYEAEPAEKPKWIFPIKRYVATYNSDLDKFKFNALENPSILSLNLTQYKDLYFQLNFLRQTTRGSNINFMLLNPGKASPFIYEFLSKDILHELWILVGESTCDITELNHVIGLSKELSIDIKVISISLIKETIKSYLKNVDLEVTNLHEERMFPDKWIKSFWPINNQINHFKINHQRKKLVNHIILEQKLKNPIYRGIHESTLKLRGLTED